jgi:hypothetical protein
MMLALHMFGLANEQPIRTGEKLCNEEMVQNDKFCVEVPS